MPLVIVTPPAAEPLTLAMAKAHLRVDSTDEDTWITTAIQAAREDAEGYTERAFVTQALRLYLDSFPYSIDLPRPPVQSVESITYLDADGAEQTLAESEYQTDLVRAPDSPTPPRILPAYGKSWPVTRAVPNAVWIDYTAGYGAGPDNVPARLRAGMLLNLGDAFENRSTIIVGTVSSRIPLAAEDCFARYRVRP
jgi:uncharacterized phiE125 gp8 family phage protein